MHEVTLLNSCLPFVFLLYILIDNISQCKRSTVVKMINVKSENNSLNLSEDNIFENRHKSTVHKWPRFRRYITNKCANIRDIKDKSIYIETLSASSVKRTLRRIYKSIFRSRYQGYEKFLSDEEKRFLYAFDGRSLVEGC